MRAQTLDALNQLHDRGMRLVLVTGRDLPDLRRVLPHLDRFDRIVAENGALLFDPASDRQELLGAPPPASFTQELERRGASMLRLGRVIVATRAPNEALLREVIAEQALDLHVIRNGNARMVLPSAVDKGTGLEAAMRSLGIACEDVLAIGDGENDLPLLATAGWRVAVANAVPALAAMAHAVTHASRGQGVEEIVDAWLRGGDAWLRDGDAGLRDGDAWLRGGDAWLRGARRRDSD
ncbi:MAG: HAD family phosphatase [Deltaproteobacteria bacterium]|nr:HAD family phosphatase [Deltaproteobacteria bacterium]